MILTKLLYGLNSADGPTTTTGVIYAKTGNVENNISKVTIVVTPKNPIEENETIRIKIKASTEEPYKKEISCEVELRVRQTAVNSYSIEDVTNRNYMILQLVNAQNSGTPVTLEFDSNVVRIDLSDEAYVNRTEGSEITDSKGYVKEFKFNMLKESTKYIKFYKVDISKDYTYPLGSTDSIIKVKSE